MTEQVNIPKVRFSDFEANWSQYALKDVATLTSGMHLSPEEYSTSGTIPYFTGPSDITSNVNDVTKFTEKSKQVAKFGEIFITVKGSGVGKTAFCKLPKAFMGRQLMSINASAALNPLIQALLEERINKLESLAMGNLIPGLSRVDILSLKMFLPDSEEEQQKIASFLSKVDEKIMLLTEKKDKLTEYKKGVMQQLFNGSFQEQDGQLTFIPPTLRFKADDGSEFPDWEEKTMVSLFPQIRNGFVGTATPFYASSDNGVKYLQGKNIKKNRIDDSGLIYVNNTFHVKNTKSQLKVDDIVMVQSGHVGECARITKEFDGANCHALLVASPNLEKVNSSYFVYYFYSPIGKAQTHKITTGNTIKHILGSDLKDIKVNAPSLSEQTKIASFLSTIDQKIDLANSQLDKAKEWKKGLLQQMFV